MWVLPEIKQNREDQIVGGLKSLIKNTTRLLIRPFYIAMTL